MRVFRIERAYQADECRNGGYYHSGLRDTFGMKNPDAWRHPAPREDGIKLIDGWLFGFATVHTFANWFCEPDHRHRLANFGGVLRVYDVPNADVRIGSTQVMFNPTNARLVRTLRPDHFDHLSILGPTIEGLGL